MWMFNDEDGYILDHASRAAPWASTCCGESGPRRPGSPGRGRDTFGFEYRSGSNKQADNALTRIGKE